MINQEILNDMTYKQLVKKIQHLDTTVEKNKENNRISSKKYYYSKFQLSEDPTSEEVENNKEAIKKRDKFQKEYYEKNKERIKERQRLYRLRKKLEKEKETDKKKKKKLIIVDEFDTDN